MGIGAILGVLASTVSAFYFKYSKEEIENGIYGFNGTLVGIAVYFLFGFSLLSTLAIISGAIFSSIILNLMKKRVPVFTAPFVLATWVLIFGIKLFHLIPLADLSLVSINSLNLFSGLTTGFGQVMFQGNIITGLIFFIAILINSRRSALYALYGSILGLLFARALNLPLEMINIGLFGYNAVLCGIALGNEKYKPFILATLGILFSVLINLSLNKGGIISLTAPFVLAIWIVLFLQKKLFRVEG